MKNNEQSNEELIQMIKNFMYDSKFKDLGIFSKQYLSSVLYSMYENNSNSLFSLAFGDFDGLRALNDKYSLPVGDLAMYDSLAIIKKTLPKNTIIARAAGDEFIFLSTSLDKQGWDKVSVEIRENLSKNSDKIHGLNITMSGMDSRICPTFKELYNLAELDVNRKKHNSQQKDQMTTDEIFKDKILNDFRKYFNYYRLNEGTEKSIALPDSYFKVLSSSLIDIVLNRFEKTDASLDLYMEKLENTLVSNETFLDYLNVSKESAFAMHNVLTEHPKFGDRKKINGQELDNVYKFLIRDPLTGEYSKNYFKNYLLEKVSALPKKNISIQVFDLVHLKLSNDTITHVKTDQKISELFGHIVYGLRSKVDYSDFEHDSGNYLVSFGGKLISIQNGNFTIPKKEISKILEHAKSNQRILDIVTARKSGTNVNLQNMIDDLSDNCIAQKHDLKVNKITSEEAIVPLNIALNDSISYFIDTHKDPYSFASKRHLLTSLWNGMRTVVGERFPNMPSSSVRVIKKDDDKLNISTNYENNNKLNISHEDEEKER